MSDREAFEKWAKGLLDLQHIGPCYGDEATQTAFEAWQAALQSGESSRAMLDAVTHGTGITKGGKHVPLEDFYVQHSGEPVVDADAKREAESLAMSLWQKWYKDDSPNFELCDSVAGVITQINNMTAGLVREDVSWGVDWGRSGDRSCVSICKSFPDGSLEIVATEFSPYTTPQPVVPEGYVLVPVEPTEAMLRAWFSATRESSEGVGTLGYFRAAYKALLSAGKETDRG